MKKFTHTCLLLTYLITLLTYSLPAQAAPNPDSQLEQQVLQIIREHPEVIIESVQTYQQQQRQEQEKQQQAFLKQITANPQLVIGTSPTTGAKQGEVVLLEFSDFQCPFCAEAYETLKEFMAEHPETITLAYKHYPLSSIHPQALPAAQAAWAAGQQGKFWEYHDALFENQDKLGEDFYLEAAQNLNLNLPEFNRDRSKAPAVIRGDMELARESGISGTPFFIMFSPDTSKSETFSGAVPLSKFAAIFTRISRK